MLHLRGTKHRKPIVSLSIVQRTANKVHLSKEMEECRSGVVAARKHWIFDSMAKKDIAKETAASFGTWPLKERAN